MRHWPSYLTALLLSLTTLVSAIEISLDQTRANRERCSGMYSRNSWAGDTDPFILVKFKSIGGKRDNGNSTNDDDDDNDNNDNNGPPKVSLIMYEWKDQPLLGKPAPNDNNLMYYICDDKAVNAKLCKKKDTGQFIVKDNADEKRKNFIENTSINLKKPKPINYQINSTGYYCIATYSKDQDYTAIVEFRNSYGELPAAQIAKLPFYGGLAIVYAVVAAYWTFLYVQHRDDILPVQNYITAIIVFLIVEMIMTWGFYDYQNVHGNNVGTKAFMIVVSILNAGRNSFSFFLLLIVCMGYGVVKPSLGKKMTWVRYLAIAHFVFGVIYAVASLTIHPDDAGPLVLLVILPLSASLTAFYIWTLNSLSATIKDLVARKQSMKVLMYKRLWWCILGSILIIFAFFFFNSFTFVGVGDPNFAPEHWQTRWFILDGWLNLVYLADVCIIAYLWRPTANNRQFAMSDELAQDDDGGFEIASINSRDSLDDLEEGRPTPSTGDSGLAPGYSSLNRRDNDSPLPAPKPQRVVPPPRESLDGETMFAVGDDDGDKWSDDESDEERAGLTGRKHD